MQNTISVLIITYNRADDLLSLLYSIKEQNEASEVLEEVLILNNGSTDSYAEIKNFADTYRHLKINFIDSKENLGVARGRNKLLPMAKGDLILVIDDDVVFQKNNDLKTLQNYFDRPIFKQANTAVITPRVIYHSTKEVQKSAFPHKKYEKYKDKPQFLTSYFIGCAHLMKRELLQKTGLYPTDFFYGMEEYDLAYQILDAGYTMGYDNSVTIEHKESPLGRQANYKRLQMMWINKTKIAWWYLPFRYFVSTAIMWNFEYIKKVKGHPGAYLESWAKILSIPFKEKTKKINKKALAYLKSVEARLGY